MLTPAQAEGGRRERCLAGLGFPPHTQREGRLEAARVGEAFAHCCCCWFLLCSWLGACSPSW